MDEPGNKGLQGSRCLAYAAAVILGVALAWASSPAIFRALPTDMTRIGVMLDALADTQQSPRVLLFGTSVGMASADMGQVSRKLEGQPLAWNLASTGQTPTESYLYYQQLPDSVRLVVQLVNPTTLTNWNVLEEQKFNAFYMYGYRPDERTAGKLSSILGDDMAEILERSDFTQRFDSRWAARQMADHYARGLMRQDLTLEQGTYDLVYPSSYTTRLPDALFERALEDRFGGAQKPAPFYAKPNKLELLAELQARAVAEGFQLVFVLQPQHPAQHEFRAPGYFDEARRVLAEFAAANDAIVLDATDLIPGDLYVDPVHPAADGAVLFSSWLAGELNRLQASGRVDF